MATISFNRLAQQLDTLNPPASLKDLLRRFSYTDTEHGQIPPGPQSFRAVASRLANESCVQLSLLQYNIWCLRATIKFNDFVYAAGGLNHFVGCLGVDLTDLVGRLIERAGIEASDLCDILFPPVVSVCGVSPNPLNNTCKLAGGLLQLAGYVIQEFSSSLDEIVDFLNLPYDLVFQILAEMLNFELAWVKEKPNILGRALAIGNKALAYDIISLNEAWVEDARKNILTQGNFSFVEGPKGSTAWKHLQSGLLVLSPTLKLEDGGGHVYATAGVQRLVGNCDLGIFHDSDHWANKGVQLTRIHLQVGTIELYSTHLYSGGEFILAEPDEAERAQIRAAQVAEMIAFIKATHQSGNIAIVAGDFNISAASGSYLQLKSSMAAIGFDDLWNVTSGKNGGRTNRHGDGGAPIYSNFDTHCKIFLPGPSYGSRYDPARATPRGNDGVDYFCDELQLDNAEPDVTGQRIDYIFIQRPTTHSRFYLDASRVRRRVFKWPGASAADADLSDHLGLEVTLFASPKP